MRYLGLIFCLINFTGAFSQENGDLGRKEQKFVKSLFQEDVETELITLSDQYPALAGYLREGDQVYLLKMQDLVSGYLFSTRAMGRYDYFDYLVAYAPDLSVQGLTITAYRSSHGAAICQKNWLSQFKSYAGEDLVLGKDIDAVAGATISAGSLLEDMKRCYLLMTALKEAKLLL